MQSYVAILEGRARIEEGSATLGSTPKPLSQSGAKVTRLSEWPTKSLENEQRFGCYHAQLFPFIGKRVWTPSGSGTLLSAFAEQCEVLPDGAAKTARVRTEDVLPFLARPVMNAKRKGSRNEHRTIPLLQAAGYSCTQGCGFVPHEYRSGLYSKSSDRVPKHTELKKSDYGLRWIARIGAIPDSSPIPERLKTRRSEEFMAETVRPVVTPRLVERGAIRLAGHSASV